MKIVPMRNYRNESELSLAHVVIKNKPRYVKSITERRIFPVLYRYKFYSYFTTHNRTDYVKKNVLTAGYKKHIEQEKADNIKQYREYHYL